MGLLYCFAFIWSVYVWSKRVREREKLATITNGNLLLVKGKLIVMARSKVHLFTCILYYLPNYVYAWTPFENSLMGKKCACNGKNYPFLNIKLISDLNQSRYPFVLCLRINSMLKGRRILLHNKVLSVLIMVFFNESASL